MSLSRLLFAAPIFATTLLGLVPALADDVIPPKVIVRRFPEGQFCALPVSISFVAPANPVIITFTAYQFVNYNGTLVWTDQAIDNVTIAPSSVVAANTFGPPLGGNSENCYNGDPAPVTYFYFNEPGLTLNLLEQFDSNPTPRGWNMSKGGVYLTNRSAPRNVVEDIDPSFGSIGFGTGKGVPDTTETKSVSIEVSGLTEGESYDLGAWWDAKRVRFPHDQTYLEITITTDIASEVARASWGALKRRYR